MKKLGPMNSVGKTSSEESQQTGVSWVQRAAVLAAIACLLLQQQPRSQQRGSRATWGQDGDTCVSPLRSLHCQGCTPQGADSCWLQDEIGAGAAGRELREIIQTQWPWQAEEGGKCFPPVFSRQKVHHHYLWGWPMLDERKEESPFYKWKCWDTHMEHISLI